ncbi:MAG: NADH:ubiquinone reductase (Na(+)-transporting) subunit C [Bacteroidetes bacterium]|jgi:Na+-transporting NADH:ubiquinone oxidoreductase subunit C|nr:NADH:ubiquinone reductase (Na(+)-transporting) subunit C [Bacteroidota bacterium]
MESSNKYIITFIIVMTVIAAVALAGMREITMSAATRNEEIFNKRSILLTVNEYLGDGLSVADLTDEQVLKIFKDQVEQIVINQNGEVVPDMLAEKIDLAIEKKKPETERLLPLFVFKNNKEKFYILSIRGSGLWDEIWGNIAVKSDLNTIAGATFDHKGETPGLGAEIKDNPAFPGQFVGKQMFKDGEVAILVRKGGSQDKLYEVDGISGATITGDGVSEMLQRGIAYYLPYFESIEN